MFSDRSPADRGEIVGLLQEWVGAALSIPTLGREQRKALILVGPSRAGKTLLARIVGLLLGGTIAAPTVTEISDTFGLEPFLTANAWIRDDAINEGDSLDPQRIKALITGETVSVRRKNKTDVFVAFAIPTLWTTNALPRARDASDAIYNRALVIEMFKVVSEDEATAVMESLGVSADSTLADFVFEREGPGILNWALDGLKRLRERRRFIIPDAVHAAGQRFKDDNNPVGQFARSYLEKNERSRISRADLRCALHGWQREEEGDSARAMGGRAFKERLKAACPWITESTTVGRRYWDGIALTKEGLAFWKAHNDGVQLKNGQKGDSLGESEVNALCHSSAGADSDALIF
jgi:P4 family phage/plasmid primase-like protien